MRIYWSLRLIVLGINNPTVSYLFFRDVVGEKPLMYFARDPTSAKVRHPCSFTSALG